MSRVIDTSSMIGEVYGRLSVISPCTITSQAGTLVTCYCSCGRGYKNIIAADLLRGKTAHCGCSNFPSIGTLFTNKSGLDFILLDYYRGANNYTMFLVEFIGSGYITRSAYKEIKSGSIKDRLIPNVGGVGFLGGVKYKTNGVDKVCYQTWLDMILRCYAPKNEGIAKRYHGVSVCKDWHNYQNYAPWYKDNFIKGYHVDKDLKVFNSKLYSPETCVFVPEALNSFLTGGLKRGIHFNKNKGLWISQCQNGEVTSTGNKK